MESFLDRLLTYYSLTKEDYARFAAEPSFSSLPMINFSKAAYQAKSRLARARDNKEKTIIYGDYDTDGIMATSIMVKALREFGMEPSYFIPSRYKDGYGLTKENAVKIADAGYKLVILVDNGVSCLEQVSYLLSRGIETLIIDHHELPEILPPASCTLHPELIHYGEVPVSAGYLSFIFSCYLLDRIDEYLAVLGALSIISDLMPIKSHNREIVRLALRLIRKNNYPQISYLTEKKYIDERTLGMEVIPAINAIGRMDKEHRIRRLVSYFADPVTADTKGIAEWMLAMNEERKKATKDAQARLRLDPNEPGIVVVGTLPEGLNGLLANRLMNEYKKPTVVFSPSESDPSTYVGSIRSTEGFNVIECLTRLKDLTVKSGGHAHAGGVSIKKENYGEFKKGFLFESLRQKMVPAPEVLIPLQLSECNMDHYRILRDFGPFGHDFEAPKFCIEICPDALQWHQNGFLLSPLGLGVKLFGYSIKKDQMDFRKEKIYLKSTFNLNEFRGKANLDINVELLPENPFSSSGRK